MTERFSDRQGYRPNAAKITVRENAPSGLRGAIPLIAEEAGMTPSAMRQAICKVLLVPPDPNNWSDYPNVWEEVVWLVQETPWYKVYDIAEALYAKLATNRAWDSEPADEFERRLNDFFVEHGIGWELRDGQIVHRGSEAFARSTHEVPDRLGRQAFSVQQTKCARP